jgi:hypothetical protein
MDAIDLGREAMAAAARMEGAESSVPPTVSCFQFTEKIYSKTEDLVSLWLDMGVPDFFITVLAFCQIYGICTGQFFFGQKP